MEKINVNIRNYEERDLREIIQLNVNEYQWNDNFNNLTKIQKFEKARWWFDKKLLKWHIDILKRCRGGIILAIHDNQIIGELDYAMSIDSNDRENYERLHIIWILIDKKYRNKNVATTLIDYLKQNHSNISINVEAEDNRSFLLYSKLGKEFAKIENWSLFKNNFITQNNFSNKNYNIIEYSSVVSFLKNNVFTILGRYYCPEFDLLQLSNSNEVHEFIWGEMNQAEIFQFKTDDIEVLSIMTQYPRIYINQIKKTEKTNKDLISIFIHIHEILFSYGFDVIYIQIYSEHNSIINLIQNVGYIKTEEDVLFQI